MLDEQGRIAEIAIRGRLDAHRVVEDFMIAANVAAAQALEAKTAPVVYRIHEPPAREKLIALRDYLKTFGRSLALGQVIKPGLFNRSEEHTSELQSIMRISYAVFCLKKKNKQITQTKLLQYTNLNKQIQPTQ